jgi:hypothetical protein
MNKKAMQDFGVIYVAFGLPYVYMTYLSIRSLLHFNPNIEILVVTNVAGIEKIMNFDGRVKVKYVKDKTENNRLYKLSVNDLTIFKKTLYIDSDTIITGSIYEAKDYLDYFDLCIKQKKIPLRINKKGLEIVPVINKRVFELPSWNGGIIFFIANNETQKFFSLWKQYYKEAESEYDQTSLISAIYLSKCKVLSLEERWNCSDVERLYRSNTIRDSIIVHYTSRLTPTIKKELLSIEKIFIEKKSSFEKELSIYFEKEKKHRMNKQGKIIYYEELVNVYFYEIRVLIKKISTTLSSLIRK